MPFASALRIAWRTTWAQNLPNCGQREPLGGPSRLGVGGERHAHPQAVAPPGQERVARLGRQDRPRGRLGPGDHVAEQERGLVESISARTWVGRTTCGRERLLVDRRLAGRDRLLGEDLRDRARVVGEVVPAVADPGDLLEQVLVGAARRSPTVETVIRSAAIAWAIPSKSPGAEMPSVRMITCLSLATAALQGLVAPPPSPGPSTVPPPASIAAIRSSTNPLSVQGCSSLTQKFSPSKAMHADLVAGPEQLDRRSWPPPWPSRSSRRPSSPTCRSPASSPGSASPSPSRSRCGPAGSPRASSCSSRPGRTTGRRRA